MIKDTKRTPEKVGLFDTTDLRNRIIEKYGDIDNFAVYINVPKASIENVLDGNRYLKQSEIDLWVDTLEIIATDIQKYFFTKKTRFLPHTDVLTLNGYKS